MPRRRSNGEIDRVLATVGGRTALDQPLIALNGVVQVALDEEADSTDAETIVGRQHVLVGKPLREL